MILFSIFFVILVAMFLLWLFTTPRRLKGKGLDDLSNIDRAPIDKAQMLALASEVERQIDRHSAVWSALGGFKGLILLHHSAACLIEKWARLAPEGCDDERADLDRRFYGLGGCVVLAGIEAILHYPLNWLTQSKSFSVPIFHATFAVVLYAEIESRIETLYEGCRPDLLTTANP